MQRILRQWADENGQLTGEWCYSAKDVDARVAELEAENGHLKKSQKITIHPPAITESEVIKQLQDFLKDEREERFRLEAELGHEKARYASLQEDFSGRLKPAYDYVDGIAVSVAEDEIDRLQAEVVRLQADKKALAEQSNRFRGQRNKVMAENERLRKAIFTAPHNMGCACLQGGPTLPHWGKLEFCDCWKKAALKEVGGDR